MPFALRCSQSKNGTTRTTGLSAAATSSPSSNGASVTKLTGGLAATGEHTLCPCAWTRTSTSLAWLAAFGTKTATSIARVVALNFQTSPPAKERCYRCSVGVRSGAMSAPSRSAFEKLQTALGGTARGNVTHFIARVGDLEICALPRVGSKGELVEVGFVVKLDRSLSDAPIVFRREARLDRLGKILRINREVQTGDHAFDPTIYVESDASDNTVAHAISSGAVRGRILEMLEDRFVDSVTLQNAVDARTVDRLGFLGDPLLAHETVRISIPAARLADVVAIRAALVRLANLHDAFLHLGEEDGGPYGRARGRVASPRARAHRARWGRALFVLGSVLAIGVVWIFGETPPTLGAAATGVGLGVGVTVWMVAMVVIARLFRGRSTSLRTVGMFAVLSAIVVPFGPAAVRRINARTDSSPVSIRQGLASIHHNAKGPNTVELVPSWRPGASVSIPFDLVRGPLSWDGAHPAAVATRSGAFGWEWVVSIEVEPHP